MNPEVLLTKSDAPDRPVRFALIGAGDFGRSLIPRIAHLPALQLAVLCDTDSVRLQKAAAPLRQTDLHLCGEAAEVFAHDFEVLVEATGNPEAAAVNALKAIETGRHVVMVSKEADILVGPILAQKARARGLVYTAVEGDQPSLLMGLIGRVRSLGLNIIAAGKASEYDFILENGARLSWRGQAHAAEELCRLAPSRPPWPELIAARKAASPVPVHTVADYCEMGLVANGTGLLPDGPVMHAPIIETRFLPDLLQAVEDGGLLRRTGVIDVFNCLRTPDIPGFAGGVFVIVECEDRFTWDMLRDKGHLVAANGKAAMIYNPQHLLGLEAPLSILAAARLGLPTGVRNYFPHVDVTAVAERDFKAGEVLAITDPHHHAVAGLGPRMTPARPLVEDAPCPYYLAVGRSLTEDVAAGTALTCAMVALDTASSLWQLRRQQDAEFFPNSSPENHS